MSFFYQNRISKRRLATFLLLWNAAEVSARPAPQDAPVVTTAPITAVTATATGTDGKTVVQTFTPTSFSISGLVPPITAPTTVTTTIKHEDTTSVDTVAIAVAAGAGIVAAGALAAWLFKPVPGQPPAPTDPPKYSTSSQDEQQHTTNDPPKTSDPPSCPFPTGPNKVDFPKADNQPQWNVALPSYTTSSFSPKCTKQGDNNQLLRGTDPGYVKELGKVFCKNDLRKDQSKELGQADLPSDSNWKNDKLQNIRVKFDFKFKNQNDACPQNCNDAISSITSMCQYNSHSMFGGGSLEQGCGTYNYMIDGDPRTETKCTFSSGNVFMNYAYRDAALDAINNFCTANDGKKLKQNDEGSWIKETGFTASYSDKCQGSGTYTIDKDLCKKYLQQTVDNCDTNTVTYKHGGVTTDTDNCGAFEFHPTAFDTFSCYPANKDAGFISQGEHNQISKDIAEDAISRFCDRGGDQKYTLDPNKIPDSGNFYQNVCTTDGFASCQYYYNNDGSLAKEGSLGDYVVSMSATYQDYGDQFKCSKKEKYEIHGDRCKRYLRKVMGVEPDGQCKGSDPNKLDLGTFLESAEKGCVLWNFYSVKTH